MARRGNSSYRPRVQGRRQFLAGAAGFGGALLLGPSLLGAEQSTDAAPQVLNNAPVPSLPSLLFTIPIEFVVEISTVIHTSSLA